MSPTSAGIIAASDGVAPTWTQAMTALAPYAWYKMNEASGTTLIDSGSNPVNGVTAASNITHNQSSLIPGNTSGKSKITANGGQIDTGAQTKDNIAGFTVVWTYKGQASNVVGNGQIFRCIDGQVRVEVGASNIMLAQFGAATAGWSLGSRAPLLVNTPVLCTLVCIQGDQRLYINDSLNGSASVSPGSFNTTASQFRFARSGGSDYLSGGYDDIALIAAPLTTPQVESLYDSWLSAAA